MLVSVFLAVILALGTSSSFSLVTVPSMVALVCAIASVVNAAWKNTRTTIKARRAMILHIAWVVIVLPPKLQEISHLSERYLSEIGHFNYNERRQAASSGDQTPQSGPARFRRNPPQCRNLQPEK